MKFKIQNRQSLSATILIFYLIPLLFFFTYSIKLMSPHKSWALLSLGLMILALGTLALMLILFYWEELIKDKVRNYPPFSTSIQKHSNITIAREEKVTSFEPLTFKQMPTEELHSLIPKESKELNLLQSTLKDSQEQVEQLLKALDLRNLDLLRWEQENKEMHLKVQQITQDFADYKLFSEEQLKQKQFQLTSLQQIVEDQRTEMEKRQDQIHQLDAKVHDLRYEIKTLLYLQEEETATSKSTIVEEKTDSFFLEPEHQIQDNITIESPIKTAIEASSLLKKCINTAQKLTGAHYYSNETSRFREFSSSYYSIDQRRLFDNLRSETRALIIVYSQKEQKLLFANHESKTLLGWSPDKFIADFTLIMHEAVNDWKKALGILAVSPDSQARLLAKMKNGQEVFLHCSLGVIPTGMFKQHVIGILYPAV